MGLGRVVQDTVSTGGRVPLSVDTLRAIVTGLAESAELWVEQLDEDPASRTGVRLLATCDYDVWLLGWPPMSSVTPHDHGDSAGVFKVVAGELVETRWRGLTRRSRTLAAGQVANMPRGTIHDVRAGAGRSLSVHAYSPPLTSMSFYDGSASRPLRRTAVEDCRGPIASTRVLHPAGRV
jgi:predicted metal-dependent enzyme (double-stranded beta helix superfamily)